MSKCMLNILCVHLHSYLFLLIYVIFKLLVESYVVFVFNRSLTAGYIHISNLCHPKKEVAFTVIFA